MSKFFQYFPKTSFPIANTSFKSSKVCVNILAKTLIIDNLLKDDPYIYLPYTIRDDERPEDVAEFYYGSVDYVWLVYMSNDIIDPYDEWVKNTRQFDKYIKMKYKEEASEANTDPIVWAKSNTIHYENINSGFIITPETYTLSGNTNLNIAGFTPNDWSAISYYTYEEEENEKKRSIKLINDAYKITAESNLRRLLQQV